MSARLLRWKPSDLSEGNILLLNIGFSLGQR